MLPDNDSKQNFIKKTFNSYRGNKLLLTGYRNGDTFRIKTYKNTNSHAIYHIDELIGNEMSIRHERFSVNNAIEEDEYEGE